MEVDVENGSPKGSPTRRRLIGIVLGFGAVSAGGALQAGCASRPCPDGTYRSESTGRCERITGGCFLTTACCDELGLADDCFELRTLRRFRDGYLAHRPGGEEQVHAYYELAPQLLASIPAGQRRSELLRIYARYILPSAVLAFLGLNAMTAKLYKQGLRSLMLRYTMS